MFLITFFPLPNDSILCLDKLLSGVDRRRLRKNQARSSAREEHLPIFSIPKIPERRTNDAIERSTRAAKSD